MCFNAVLFGLGSGVFGAERHARQGHGILMNLSHRREDEIGLSGERPFEGVPPGTKAAGRYHSSSTYECPVGVLYPSLYL